MVTALGEALWPEALQALCQYTEISNRYLNRLLTLEYLLIESEAGEDRALHIDFSGAFWGGVVVVKILILPVLP